MIKRIAIFDFDGTLFRSPLEPDWWKAGSWWRSAKSLDPPCVPAKPDSSWWNSSVVGQAKRAAADPQTLTVLLTGRWAQNFRPRVRELLKQKGLTFDQTLLPSSPGSLPFKKAKLSKMVDEYPGAKTVEVWDDHPEHTKVFKSLLSKEGLDVRINNVSVRPHEPECPTPVESRRGRLGLMKICEGLTLNPTEFHTQVRDLRHVRPLQEADTKPLQQGQLKYGMKIPFGKNGSTLYMVMKVNAKRATLERVTPSTVDVGPKLRGKGGKLVMTWDGTGYGKNALKRVRPGETMPKYYARADGLY
jgi:hypothetical protein